MDPTALLRPGLLADRVVALGGGDALAPPLARLGATTVALAPVADEEAATAQVADALAANGALDVLVHDLRPAFGAGGQERLEAALDGAWITLRAVAVGAFLPAGEGRLVLLAPPPADDPSAAGVRATAESLARTLSIEWSRHGVRTVAITPGAATSDGELAALAGFLASPAGDYFSGCRLALGELALG